LTQFRFDLLLFTPFAVSRPTNVTVVAALILALGGLAILTAIIALSTRSEHQETSVLVLALGSLGVVTGAGVLRLQAWARQLVLVSVGLSAFFMAILAPVILFFTFPINAGIPERIQRGRPIIVFVGFFITVIGLWCAQTLYKQAELFETAEPQQPFSVVVVGSFLTLAGITGAVGLFNIQQPPTMTFGFVLTGWTAFAVLLVYSAVSLSLGIGLLNRHEARRKAAIYYALFQVLNNGAFLLRPDRQRAIETFYQERVRYSAASAARLSVEGLSGFLRFWSMEACILALLAIWLLKTHDKAARLV
jgi:hypothetical protein